MRYSMMLQVVGIIMLILVGTAGLFAWLQNREIAPSKLESRRVILNSEYDQFKSA